jgi:hypothetical protein
MPRKNFPLRIDGELYSVIEEMAADELRSVNGQIEFLLRDALRRAGRLPEQKLKDKKKKKTTED